MKKYTKYLTRADRLYFGLVFFLNTAFLFAGPWPGDLPGVEIGDSLPGGYEPSGAVWHTRLNKFFTVWDNGMVSMMDFDGTDVTNWSVSGDLEGVCVADTASDFIYVGLERPNDGIKEFNFVSGEVTRFFDLTPWMQSVVPNLGLEALTFVPDTTHPEGGLFYAGLQENGKIYVFELPITSSPVDTLVTFVDTIIPDPLYPGISGLHYDTENKVLYAIWSSVQRIRAMNKDGETIVEWDLPGDTQEGIALWKGESPGQCQIFIAEDAGEVWRYDFNSILDITIIGNGAVNLQPDPPNYYGTYEILNAVADPDHQFVEWSGDLTGNANPETLLMDYDKDVTAIFEPDQGVYEHGADFSADFLYISPNPFLKLTKIDFGIKHRAEGEGRNAYGVGRSTLKIYDATGCLIKNFVLPTSNFLLPTSVVWYGLDDQGQEVPAGSYFCELKVNNSRVIEKVVFLK